jgi:hypothetical protein
VQIDRKQNDRCKVHEGPLWPSMARAIPQLSLLKELNIFFPAAKSISGSILYTSHQAYARQSPCSTIAATHRPPQPVVQLCARRCQPATSSMPDASQPANPAQSRTTLVVVHQSSFVGPPRCDFASPDCPSSTAQTVRPDLVTTDHRGL